jgi:hypothetical protein
MLVVRRWHAIMEAREADGSPCPGATGMRVRSSSRCLRFPRTVLRRAADGAREAPGLTASAGVRDASAERRCDADFGSCAGRIGGLKGRWM